MSTSIYLTYEQRIVAATGCKPEDAERVEEIMRCQYGTLDHLPAREFNAEARISFEVMRRLCPSCGADLVGNDPHEDDCPEDQS